MQETLAAIAEISTQLTEGVRQVPLPARTLLIPALPIGNCIVKIVFVDYQNLMTRLP